MMLIQYILECLYDIAENGYTRLRVKGFFTWCTCKRVYLSDKGMNWVRKVKEQMVMSSLQ
jgi:hypothetical protein